MSRIIKFRQWCGNRFEYWGVGIDDNTFVGPCSGGGLRADQTPHQQFTGLHDKNGKEIFEGDHIEARIPDGNLPFIGVVQWADDLACFSGWNFGGDSPLYMLRDVVVTGNLHENPELLERL